jgi:hypothetical protein
MEPTEMEEQKDEKTVEPEAKPKKKRGGSNRGVNLYGRAFCPGKLL